MPVIFHNEGLADAYSQLSWASTRAYHSNPSLAHIFFVASLSTKTSTSIELQLPCLSCALKFFSLARRLFFSAGNIDLVAERLLSYCVDYVGYLFCARTVLKYLRNSTKVHESRLTFVSLEWRHVIVSCWVSFFCWISTKIYWSDTNCEKYVTNPDSIWIILDVKGSVNYLLLFWHQPYSWHVWRHSCSCVPSRLTPTDVILSFYRLHTVYCFLFSLSTLDSGEPSVYSLLINLLFCLRFTQFLSMTKNSCFLSSSY